MIFHADRKFGCAQWQQGRFREEIRRFKQAWGGRLRGEFHVEIDAKARDSHTTSINPRGQREDRLSVMNGDIRHEVVFRHIRARVYAMITFFVCVYVGIYSPTIRCLLSYCCILCCTVIVSIGEFSDHVGEKTQLFPTLYLSPKFQRWEKLD